MKKDIDVFISNWKFSYYKDLQSFKNPTLKNQTALSKYNWDLKELG